VCLPIQVSRELFGGALPDTAPVPIIEAWTDCPNSAIIYHMDRSNLRLGVSTLSLIAAQATEDQLVGQTEVCRLLGIPRSTLTYHVKRGHLSRYLRGYLLLSDVKALFQPDLLGKWRGRLKDGAPVSGKRQPEPRRKTQVERADVLSRDWIKKRPPLFGSGAKSSAGLRYDHDRDCSEN